ncbi:MAG: nucleotidyltransferase family protein [Candidatus Bathyarchaeia archaeon]
MPVVGLVLAAGRGRRLAPYTDAVAKELLPVGEFPVIEYNLRYLEAAGVSKVFIVIGEGKEQIVRYVKDGRRFGLNVAYLFQDAKRAAGTAKAIEAARPWVNGDFIVAYGDAFFHPGGFVKEMLQFHEERGSWVTVGLYEVTNPSSFAVAKLDENMRMLDIVERPSPEQMEQLRKDGVFLANSGPLVFNRAVFGYIAKTALSPDREYWITDTVRLMLRDGHPVYGFRIPPSVFWRDVGTPQSRLEADQYALSNLKVPTARS